MKKSSSILKSFQAWYSKLQPMKQYGGRPAKGTVAAALIVLERLRTKCDLRPEAHIAAGGAQIAGLNPSSLRKILKRLGENRKFPSEGGRTNRGNNRPVQLLLETLSAAGFGKLGTSERSPLIGQMQRILVQSLDAYYRLEGVRFEFNPQRPARHIISEILAFAEKRNQSGPVAQHLVGAKLAIRFPSLTIGNFAYSAADDQGGRQGDFQIGTTAFHVTVAPTQAHARRCSKNLRDGIQALLLVPDSKVDKARILIEVENVGEKVAVESVQSFVGQNVSELAEFTPEKFVDAFRDLIQAYNTRVGMIETDTSLLIEVPASLS